MNQDTHIRYKTSAPFKTNNLIYRSFLYVEAVWLMHGRLFLPLVFLQQPGRAVWKASDAAWLQTPHVHLSSLPTSPPPPPPPPAPFSLSGLAVCIISTSFHHYDNTLWGLKAIETLRETSNFMPLGKFIYFLSPSVDGGGERSGGGG